MGGIAVARNGRDRACPVSAGLERDYQNERIRECKSLDLTRTNLKIWTPFGVSVPFRVVLFVVALGKVETRACPVSTGVTFVNFIIRCSYVRFILRSG